MEQAARHGRQGLIVAVGAVVGAVEPVAGGATWGIGVEVAGSRVAVGGVDGATLLGATGATAVAVPAMAVDVAAAEVAVAAAEVAVAAAEVAVAATTVAVPETVVAVPATVVAVPDTVVAVPDTVVAVAAAGVTLWLTVADGVRSGGDGLAAWACSRSGDGDAALTGVA
jgi:hypothetical protein